MAPLCRKGSDDSARGPPGARILRTWKALRLGLAGVAVLLIHMPRIQCQRGGEVLDSAARGVGTSSTDVDPTPSGDRGRVIVSATVSLRCRVLRAGERPCGERWPLGRRCLDSLLGALRLRCPAAAPMPPGPWSAARSFGRMSVLGGWPRFGGLSVFTGRPDVSAWPLQPLLRLVAPSPAAHQSPCVSALRHDGRLSHRRTGAWRDRAGDECASPQQDLSIR